MGMLRSVKKTSKKTSPSSLLAPVKKTVISGEDDLERGGLSSQHRHTMASQPSRNRSRWGLDFNRGGRGGGGADNLPAPPGYSSNSTSVLNAETNRQTEAGAANLRAKRSWDLALGPIKQAPMNLFIMYMSGNTISIFPIMMVIMMAVRPLKTLFSVNATFKNLDSADGSGPGNLGQKVVFVLGNLVNVALALYKCHSMGMLPTYTSDWLAFADPVERAEWAYT